MSEKAINQRWIEVCEQGSNNAIRRQSGRGGCGEPINKQKDGHNISRQHLVNNAIRRQSIRGG